MSRRILILIAILAVPLSPIAGPGVQAALAQGGSMAVMTPSSGPPGTAVKASGSNWTPGDHIQAEWGDNDSNLGSPVVVASDGTFTDSFAIPSSATQGSHQVLFWDEEGRYFEVADFDVTSGSPTPPPSSCPAASVTFLPDGGPVGTTFVIAGSNWMPGGTVTSTLPYGSPGWFTGYQTPTVGTNGGFAFKETVGTGPHGPTPPGTYIFTFVEKYGGCSLSYVQKFTVTAEPSRTCTPAPQPQIYWSQISGPQGARLSLTGSGWYAHDTVTIHLPHGFYVSRTSWPADSNGDWQLNITVGDQTPPGYYDLAFSQSACGGLHLDGTFKITMTVVQYVDILKAIYLLVPAADEVGKITGGQRWDNSIVGKAVSLVSKAETVISIGISGLDVLRVHNDLNALIRDLKKAHNNKHDPTVQKDVKRLKADTDSLRDALVAIVPGLEFIFPPSVS
jgi:hypothetical protein